MTMFGICTKCGEHKELVAFGISPSEDGVLCNNSVQYCKECAEEEGYIKPISQEETRKRI